MDILDNGPRLSIQRDPEPELRVQVDEGRSWPQRLVISLPQGEVVLRWITPSPVRFGEVA